MQPDVIMVPVESTNVEAVGYDPDRSRLWVRFKGGPHYRYEGVPRPVYDALLAAPSKGQYLHREVKGKYPHHRES